MKKVPNPIHLIYIYGKRRNRIRKLIWLSVFLVNIFTIESVECVGILNSTLPFPLSLSSSVNCLCVSVSLFVCLFVCLSVSLSPSLSTPLSVSLSMCQCLVCLSVFPYYCPASHNKFPIYLTSFFFAFPQIFLFKSLSFNLHLYHSIYSSLAPYLILLSSDLFSLQLFLSPLLYIFTFPLLSSASFIPLHLFSSLFRFFYVLLHLFLSSYLVW